jgi:signal transduction histidine kinase
MGERNASLEPSSDGKQEIGRGLRTMPTVKAKNDQSERVKGIMGSASVLVAILVIFSFVSAFMLFRLFQTSSELAKSNRRAFILETKNKTTVLDEYFRKRVAEFTSLSSDAVFQTYFAAGMLNIPNKQGIGVVAGQLEQKLLVSRLAEEEQGKPVYSRMAFFDIVRGRVVARTDNSPKGRWINAAFFEGLRSKPMGQVNIRAQCVASACRIFLFGPVNYGSQKAGLLLLELAPGTVQDQIQILPLQKTDDFSGLTDSQRILILGPTDMIGKSVGTLFGIDSSVLKGNRLVESAGNPSKENAHPLTIMGSRVNGTGFSVVRVAPRSRFVGSHLALLWSLVFVSLMGALILVLLHIYRSYAERNLMYEKLQEAHDYLEIRVKERTAELEEVNNQLVLENAERRRAEEALRKAGNELKAVNRDLKDFAYVVSHDLKAPLRSVRQLVQWIVQDYSDAFDQTGKRYSDLLIGRVDLMHNLIEGILKYSRVGRIKEEKRSVDLNWLVQEVIDFIGAPTSVHISLENHLPTLMCEPTLLHEVFQNLIDNAVKYMDKPNGKIKIACQRDDRQWLFRVTDNGPGIDSAHFEKVFEIFKSVSTAEGVESTGIGLALVKKIIEQKGGRIWVESEVGQGSTFHFTLPDEDGDEEQEEMPPPT